MSRLLIHLKRNLIIAITANLNFLESEGIMAAEMNVAEGRKQVSGTGTNVVS